MRLVFKLRIMLLALSANRFRLILALSAIAIGIAAVMLTMSLNTGAQRELDSIVEKIGKNLFSIKAKRLPYVSTRGEGWYTARNLNKDDVTVIREQVNGIKVVVPIIELFGTIKHNRKEISTTVNGVGIEYTTVRNFEIESGRNFEKTDDQEKKRVVLLGSFVAKKIAPGANLIGEVLNIEGIPFEVIGLLKSKGRSNDGINEDDQVLIPLQTLSHRFRKMEYYSKLLIQVYDKEMIASIQNIIRNELRVNHKLKDDEKDDFEILNLIRSDQIKEINQGFLKGLSEFFALIALSISGAGVLFVTYFGVVERKSEIGLRRAIGARSIDIAKLFMYESLLLGLVGGAIGLLLGWFSVFLLQIITDWSISIDLKVVLIPMSLSLLLGLTFGVIPAIKASRLNPVEALKSE